MAIMKIGTVKSSAIFIFRIKSLYALFPSLSVGSIGTKSIPQIGHEPGPSCTISGCIGQVYFVFAAIKSGAFTKSIPQMGQSPALS